MFRVLGKNVLKQTTAKKLLIELGYFWSELHFYYLFILLMPFCPQPPFNFFIVYPDKILF